MREADLKKLYGPSGNRCAFPDCRQPLVPEGTDAGHVVLGEAAHIVAESRNGPRGQSSLSLEERNRAENRILLCARHHQLVDAQPATYSVERLKAMKADHEKWVAERTGVEDLPSVVEFRRDTVHSTMVAVEHLPRWIFSGPCSLALAEIIEKLMPAPGQITPFIQRDDKLYAFHDLTSSNNPFREVVDRSAVTKVFLADWLGDDDKARWVVDLLNRSLTRHCALRGLRWDREHHRYYFGPTTVGQERTVRYRPLNSQRTSRGVVWQPRRKATGEVRPYWLHRAVSLQFHRVEATQLVLAIRPELRVTKDGETPIESEKIGARVTRRKSRLFNYDLLNEVNFWRDYLSDSKARIDFEFGTPGQFVRISTKFMSCEITWPGLPKEHDKPFKNVEYVDDLFTWAEAQALEGEEDLDDYEPAGDAGADHETQDADDE